jgi:hypothetical protein
MNGRGQSKLKKRTTKHNLENRYLRHIQAILNRACEIIKATKKLQGPIISRFIHQ